MSWGEFQAERKWDDEKFLEWVHSYASAVGSVLPTLVARGEASRERIVRNWVGQSGYANLEVPLWNSSLQASEILEEHWSNASALTGVQHSKSRPAEVDVVVLASDDKKKILAQSGLDRLEVTSIASELCNEFLDIVDEDTLRRIQAPLEDDFEHFDTQVSTLIGEFVAINGAAKFIDAEPLKTVTSAVASALDLYRANKELYDHFKNIYEQGVILIVDLVSELKNSGSFVAFWKEGANQQRTADFLESIAEFVSASAV